MLRLYNRVGPRRSCNRSTRLSSFMPPGPAFLFDLDGTLVDSVYQHVLAWREALESVGIELSVWRIHRRIGMSGGLFVKDRKSTRLNSSHSQISYAVFCLK